jgi:hypothetical protein
VAVAKDVVLVGFRVATTDWFNGWGLLARTGVAVSWANTGVGVGTMGVAVCTNGMGLGRPDTGVVTATRGVGVAADCVGVAAALTAGLAPQLAKSKALTTNRMNIE